MLMSGVENLELLIPVAEAAKRLNIHSNRVHARIRIGSLTGFRITGSPTVYVRADDIESWNHELHDGNTGLEGNSSTRGSTLASPAQALAEGSRASSWRRPAGSSFGGLPNLE
jgi:hypothetical protein